MSGLKSFSLIACVCCISCSILSVITPIGRMKKTMNLVMGLFMICSMIIPVIGFISTQNPHIDIDSYKNDSDKSYEEYEQLVLNETADNLVLACNNLLLAESIDVNNIEIGLKKSDSNSIYISRVNIYISKDYEHQVEKIKRIISTNMCKEPVVIISES